MTDKSTEELATSRTSGEIAMPPDVSEGIDMHRGDILPAFISLVQGTSEKGEPGMFRRSDTEEEFAELNVIPVRVQKNRTYWGPGEFQRGRAPKCASPDGDYGALTNNEGEPNEFAGQLCTSCPMYTEAPWRDRDLCQPGYMAYLFDVDSFEVLGMRLTGTSAKLARKFIARSVFRRTIMKLASERKSNDHGTWYAITATPDRVVGEDEAEVMLAEAAMHSKTMASSFDNTVNKEEVVVDNKAEEAMAEMDMTSEQESRGQQKSFEEMNPEGAPVQEVMSLEDIKEEFIEQSSQDPDPEDDEFDPEKPPW